MPIYSPFPKIPDLPSSSNPKKILRAGRTRPFGPDAFAAANREPPHGRPGPHPRCHTRRPVGPKAGPPRARPGPASSPVERHPRRPSPSPAPPPLSTAAAAGASAGHLALAGDLAAPPDRRPRRLFLAAPSRRLAAAAGARRRRPSPASPRPRRPPATSDPPAVNGARRRLGSRAGQTLDLRVVFFFKSLIFSVHMLMFIAP